MIGLHLIRVGVLVLLNGFVYFGSPKDFFGIRNCVFIRKQNIICKELKTS